MSSKQCIVLGDCLDVFANERNVSAFCSDVPANIAFMGRSWDKANGDADGFSPMLPARSKSHERELRDEYRFTKYWAIRYAMAYDIADQHAVNIVWTLPRTSHQTANALRAAGWTIKDNLVHLFGSGWAKTGNALAPGQEGWLLAVKGKPDLDIDACRVPRGVGVEYRGRAAYPRKGNVAGDHRVGAGMYADGAMQPEVIPNPLGSLPKNALLSHCEECVRVGSKRVRGAGRGASEPSTSAIGYHGGANGSGPRPGRGKRIDAGHESIPAFHCLAGCVCGANTPWPDDRPLPRCPCGETWRWLCPVAEIDAQSGDRPGMSGGGQHRNGYQGGMFGGIDCESTLYADQGGAARFFNAFMYLAKCSPSERHAGCESLYWRANKKNPFGFDQVTREEWEHLMDMQPASFQHTPSVCNNGGGKQGQRAQGNVHPTVKSYRLMHWLHSLTGTKRILDMTAGSGTGMYTAYLDDIEWLGAEICPEAIAIAEARYAFWRGLAFEAREAFMRDDVVPEPIRRDSRELLLFDFA